MLGVLLLASPQKKIHFSRELTGMRYAWPRTVHTLHINQPIPPKRWAGVWPSAWASVTPFVPVEQEHSASNCVEGLQPLAGTVGRRATPRDAIQHTQARQCLSSRKHTWIDRWDMVSDLTSRLPSS